MRIGACLFVLVFYATITNAANDIPVRLMNYNGHPQPAAHAGMLRQVCPQIRTDTPAAKYLLMWYEDASYDGTGFFLRDAYTFDNLGGGHALHLADAAKKICKLVIRAERQDVGRWRK